MKINKKAESLAGIIIGVFILSFVALGIGTLIGNSRDLIRKYDVKTQLDFLTNNSYNIIDKLDLSSIPDEEVFYLYKNTSTKKYEIKIGETNSEYKYVNKFGEKVDKPVEYKGNLFMRLFYVKKIVEDGEEKVAIRGIIKELKK